MFGAFFPSKAWDPECVRVSACGKKGADCLDRRGWGEVQLEEFPAYKNLLTFTPRFGWPRLIL